MPVPVDAGSDVTVTVPLPRDVVEEVVKPPPLVCRIFSVQSPDAGVAVRVGRRGCPAVYHQHPHPSQQHSCTFEPYPNPSTASAPPSLRKRAKVTAKACGCGGDSGLVVKRGVQCRCDRRPHRDVATAQRQRGHVLLEAAEGVPCDKSLESRAEQFKTTVLRQHKELLSRYFLQRGPSTEKFFRPSTKHSRHWLAEFQDCLSVEKNLNDLTLNSSHTESRRSTIDLRPSREIKEGVYPTKQVSLEEKCSVLQVGSLSDKSCLDDSFVQNETKAQKLAFSPQSSWGGPDDCSSRQGGKETGGTEAHTLWPGLGDISSSACSPICNGSAEGSSPRQPGIEPAGPPPGQEPVPPPSRWHDSEDSPIPPAPLPPSPPLPQPGGAGSGGSRLRALRAENARLKRGQLCVRCLQRPMNVTLLPCGHFAYCKECADQLSTCGLCQRRVVADVKTFRC